MSRAENETERAENRQRE